MIARLVRSVDFERVLRTRTRLSSMHFAVHHVAELPRSISGRFEYLPQTELSTGQPSLDMVPVDDLTSEGSGRPWLGVVVPKRHAKRSVTRSLLKRQIRTAAEGVGARLPAGLWVVRLRAPFDRSLFVSAASDELRSLARTELEGLFQRASQRVITAGA